MPIAKSELWERLRAARGRAGLRQIDIADYFGIDRTAVAQWEARRPDRRTRPDIERLRALAKLTHTPLWWLMDDSVDPTQPWPHVDEENPITLAAPRISFATHLASIWESATSQVWETRTDLRSQEVFHPAAPAWLKPFVPDAVTERAAVSFYAEPRADYERLAQRIGALNVWQQLQRAPIERRVIVVWSPQQSSGRHFQIQGLEDVQSAAQHLAGKLGVRYLAVSTRAELIEYLVQIL